MSDLAPRVRQVRCGRCAAEARLLQQMLDTGTGSTLRYMRVRRLASYAIHLPCRSQLPEEPGRIDEHRDARLAADQVLAKHVDPRAATTVPRLPLGRGL